MPTFTTKEEAIQYMKDQLESYLMDKGIPTNKMFCCLNPDHADKHPSMKFYAKPTPKVTCFSCNGEGIKATYDIFDVIGFDYGLTDPKEKFKKALEIFDVQVVDDKPQGGAKQTAPTTHQAKTPQPINTEGARQAMAEEEAAKRQEAAQKVKTVLEYVTQHLTETDYLQRRGISNETIKPFSIGYNPQYQTIMFYNSPYSMTGRAIGEVEHHERFKVVGVVDPWNIKALAGKRPVFVTEGVIDALSVIEAGGLAMALNGAPHANKFVEVVAKGHKAGKRIPPIICLMDKDKSGETATSCILEGLKPYQSVPTIDGRSLLPDKMDANDFLLSDKAEFSKRIKEAERQALKPIEDYQRANSAAGYMNKYRREIEDYEIIAQTGIDTLDKALGGGLCMGLYSVGGLSGIGKTTFMMQIGDNIARAGQDVLVFSLEMAKFDLVSKSVSRLTLLSSIRKHNVGLAKSTLDIMLGKRYSRYSEAEQQNIQEAFNEFESEISKHLYIYEAKGDMTVLPTSENDKNIKSIIEQHIRVTGNRPIVIIDYLQIIKPMDARATEKQSVDANVKALRQIAMDYKMPIIAISSFNRESYDSPISMASFKESGGIEYTSDCVLGLQYLGMMYEEEESDTGRKKRIRQLMKKVNEQRERGEAIPVQLRILKNRLAPPTDKVCFDFFSRYNYFNEIMGEPVAAGEIPEDIREQAEQQALQGL